MKLLDVETVTIEYPGLAPVGEYPLHFEDQGKMFTIKVPNEPKIFEHMRWMSDNEILQHLFDLHPKVHHNGGLIERLTRIRNYLYENTGIMGAGQRQIAERVMKEISFDDEDYLVIKEKLDYYGRFGEIYIPNPITSITWTFRETKYAVMFKLRWGSDEN